MTDLSQNAPLRTRGTEYLEQFLLDSSAAQHPYKGSPMIIDQSADTTKARAFIDATTVDPTDVFVGIAAEEKVVAAGDAETEYITVYVAPTIVGFKSSVFTDADMGKTVYMSDSGTLSTTAADNPQIGTLIRVLDGYAYVQLTAPQICAGA
jgi:hypothetical protein